MVAQIWEMGKDELFYQKAGNESERQEMHSRSMYCWRNNDFCISVSGQGGPEMNCRETGEGNQSQNLKEPFENQ